MPKRSSPFFFGLGGGEGGGMGVVECVCECVQSKVYLPVRRLDSLVMRPSRRASAEWVHLS